MYIDSKEAIGNKVRTFRIQRGLSQKQLAENICSESTISQLETGKLIPSAKILQQVCDKLGINTSDLLQDHRDQLEVDTLIDVIKIHIERAEFENAADLIDTLKERDDLARYQIQNLTLCEADYLILTNNPLSAIDILKPLYQQLEQERESDQQLLATILNKLGSASFNVSSMIDAYTYYLRAYEICTQFLQFDTLSANVSYNLGNVCRRLGKDSEGLFYVTKAKEFYEQTADTIKIAHSLFVLGITYRNLNDLEKASSSLRQALHLYESQNHIQLAEEVRHAYAYLVVNQTDPNLSIEELLKRTKTYEQFGNIPSKAYTYALAASIYLERSDVIEARPHLEFAMALVTEEQARYDRKIAFVYFTYAKYLLEVGELQKSIELGSKCANWYDMMGIDRDAADCLMILKKAYQKSGDLDRGMAISDQIIERLHRTLDKRTFLERR